MAPRRPARRVPERAPATRSAGAGLRAGGGGAGGQAAARAFSLPLRAKMAGDEAGVTLGQPHLSRQDLATLVRPARGAPGRRGEVAAGPGADEQRTRAAGPLGVRGGVVLGG